MTPEARRPRPPCPPARETISSLGRRVLVVAVVADERTAMASRIAWVGCVTVSLRRSTRRAMDRGYRPTSTLSNARGPDEANQRGQRRHKELGIEVVSSREKCLAGRGRPKVHQPYGILHGGCPRSWRGAASIGGAVSVGPDEIVVGPSSTARTCAR